MFKKSTNKPKGLRRRDKTEEDEDQKDGEAEGTYNISLQKSRGIRRPADGVLGFTSGGSKKQRPEESDDTKTRFSYASNREVQVQTDNKATASLETETEFDRDARALREKYLKRAEEALKGGKGGDEETVKKVGSGGDDKVYRGMTGYVDHTAGFRREHTVSGEKASGAHGPLRASANIRMSVRFDYQPDICKDYKETGYCGYGDSCKFMHDRGDYKSGWQLEREWEEKEKKRKVALAMGLGKDGEEDEEEEESDDDLPFACFICREPFVDPVVTKCQHYFCEHCALKHNANNRNCYVCNKPTGGVFNTAHEIIKKMKDKEEDTLKK